MYRDLIPALADRYHVVAPDLPGFGFTDAPDRSSFKYSFDHLAEVTERFTEVLGLSRYALYVFDYGAPVGFRLAVHHPERINRVNLAERQRLRGGVEQGLEPDPGLLEGSFVGKPSGLALISQARSDPVAVRTWSAHARAAVT
jgi:pimeloyl-ACP methyl ester carboxylesterase